MRRRLLKFLAMSTFRYAWLILPLALAVTGVSIWLANSTPFDMSLLTYLPSAAKQDSSLGEIISDYRKLEPVMAVVHARENGDQSAELIAVARELVRLFDNPRYFSTPVFKIDEVWRHYYESLSDVRLVMLLTPRDWAELQRLVSEKISAERLRREMANRISLMKPPRAKGGDPKDPLGALAVIRKRLANSRGPTRLEAVDGYLLSADRGAIAILLYPTVSPDNGREAYRTLNFLEECRDYVFKHHSSWRGAFEVTFEGKMVATARQLHRMEDDAQLLLKLTIPLVLLLILLVFRKVEAFFFILLPPAAGLAWTFALARLGFGGISAVTAGLLTIILAIGIQYNVHLYHRFTIELYRTHNYYRALNRAYLETGRGILASAVVVALLFFILFLTSMEGEGWRNAMAVIRDSRGFGQLGVVAGLGILCNLAACLLSLPLLAWIKHLLARGRVKPVKLYRFHLERLYTPALTNPRATLLVLLLVTVFLGYPTRDLDFSRVSAAPFFYQPEPARGGEPAKVDFPRPGRPIIAIVRGKTRQEALERNDQLYENLLALEGKYNILAYDSLRTVLPSLRSQRASLERLRALDLKPFQSQVESASKAAGFKPSIYQPFLKTLESFKAAAAYAKPIDYTAAGDDELFGTLSSTVPRYMTRLRGGDFIVTTVIYPHESGFPPSRLNQLAAELRKGGLGSLELIGDPLIERALARMVKFNLALMVLMAALIIFLALNLHYRSPRLAWLTFLPVLAEIVWLGGLMGLTGIQIHFFTVLAMPLALCLGMDNALQLTQYFHDRRPCSVRHVMLSLGRVTVLTCGITALLYGAFALAYYPGVRDFGTVVLFASGVVLIGTTMLLPALLILFGRGQSIMEALMVEDDG